MQVIRYLDPNGAKKFLNEVSTFCLQSHLVYQEMEATNDCLGTADPNEGDHAFSDGGSTAGNASLVSCWAVSSTPPLPDWDRFPKYREGVAIASTTEKVERFLKLHVEKLLGSDWWLRHQAVQYYDRDKPRPKEFKPSEMIFWKPSKSLDGQYPYEEDAEYRFAFECSGDRQNLRTIIFRCYGDYIVQLAGRPADWIDRVFIGPCLKPQDRKEIFNGICALGLVDRVENFDEELRC